MLDKNSLQRQLVHKMSLAALAGALLWAVLLSLTASRLRDITATSSLDVVFGPLALTRVAKTVSAEGATASFTFLPGLLWYALLWLAAGTLLGYVLHWRSSR